eukprot:NODE_2349_length_2230_cov_4.407513.p1 GENE.NODE_2349_length_2230_cov_4.407513~~NODE_2349_length_2230_cov_4.407513.p1  ORF type:complete len:520 (-),score=156.74 NODE_2349_length_2230_cov_4.407513:153-1712(-)
MLDEALDGRWAGIDAVTCVEVLEHLTESELARLAAALFATRPRVVVVTTPNGEFGGGSGRLRHPDHEREWSREEFRAWAQAAAMEHGYLLQPGAGVGDAPGHEAEGPCTQIAIFLLASAVPAVAPGTEILRSEGAAFAATSAEFVDFNQVTDRAVRREYIDSSKAIWKLVMREGSGALPPRSARVAMYHATYLRSGKRVSTSCEGRRIETFVIHLFGGRGLESWHRAAATMRLGEVAWCRVIPECAYGPLGLPPHIPGGEDVWFLFELVDFRLPCTPQAFKTLIPALEETERHMDMGRAALKREAYGQARQAFRRAMNCTPEKLLLGQPVSNVARFAAIERASLLNQALCSQKLAERAHEEESRQTAHWKDVIQVCTLLLERHTGAPEGAIVEVPENITAIKVAFRAIAASDAVETGPPQWLAKTYFRRAVARDNLSYLTDALADLVEAQRVAPADAEISKRLVATRRRQREVELQPSRMFADILGRERDDCEREEAARILAEKKRRRAARLAEAGAEA